MIPGGRKYQVSFAHLHSWRDAVTKIIDVGRQNHDFEMQNHDSGMQDHDLGMRNRDFGMQNHDPGTQNLYFWEGKRQGRTLGGGGEDKGGKKNLKKAKKNIIICMLQTISNS